MSETRAEDIRESGDLTSLMVKYSVPCIVSLLVGALYNIVDQIFIANADYLGSYGNAANSVVYPLTVICLAVAVTFGDGGGSFLSISLGARQKENAHRSIGNCITTVFVISIILTIIYAVFQDQILTMFGGTVNEETFQCAKEYFTWITVGVPFYMFGQSVAGMVSADGNPRFTMLCTVTGCIINVILDPIFIYVFRWGMRGAAIATITGQIFVAVLFLLYLPHLRSVKLTKDSFRVRKSLLKKIVPLGMNSFFAQASIVLSMAAVLNMTNYYGSMDPIFGQEEYAQIPTAVIGIVMKFFQIVISIAIGISAGSLPIVGYNVGAKRNDRVVGIMKRLLIAEATVGLVACLIFELFPSTLVGLFGASNESGYYTEFAISCIRIFLSLIILSCLNKGVMIFMQALGKAKYAISISVLREIVFGVGLPILLPAFMGLYGILFFMPVADLLTAFIAGFLLMRVYRELTNPDSVTSKKPAVEKQTENVERIGAKTGCVIAIGRSYGAGGRTIGRMVANELSIPYYDSGILEQVAIASGLSHHFIENIDEKPRMTSMLYSSVGALYPDYRYHEEQAIRAQHEVIEKVASEGPCVIIGRRADRILQDTPGLVSVFVTSSVESRAERVAERENQSAADATRKIQKVDREREAYYNQHSSQPWGVAETYDLCIDTDKFGIDGAVQMILYAVEHFDK